MINVMKKSGEIEPYNEDKIILSLRNSRADEETIQIILKKLNKRLYNNIPTQEIFRLVFRELRRLELSVGTRYNLKQGIIDMTLGGGFVFEKFMEKVYKKLGYKTKLNQIIKGKRITHEVDIVLEKENNVSMVECKHFSRSDLGVSIQTALYVYARFLDLKKSFDKAIIATNTKFSNQVIEYSRGVGVDLIGWKYPRDNSLEKIIERNKIYPITVLPLKKSEIRRFLEEGILTIEELEKSSMINPKIRELIKKLKK